MLQRLLMALSIGAALAMLAVLVVRTQGEPQTFEGHLGRMTAMAQLGAANVEADTQVMRARLSLESDTEGLADAMRRLESARTSLALHRDGLRAVSRDVGNAVSGLLQQLDDKQALLGSYRSQVAEFAESYAKFGQESDLVLADPALAGDASLRGSVRRLLEEVTTYSLQSSSTNQDTLDALMTQVTVGAGSAPSLRSRLLALSNAAARVVGDKDQLTAIAGKLGEVPVATTLDRLQKSYIAHYAKGEANLARYRQVLAIYAAALLAVFGIVGWRLRRSYGELDRSHDELQNLNASLEETVQARTGELRKALDDLRFQQAQLVQSEKMAALGQMVAGVAHEINTPLGYARGNVETVRESLPLVRELIEAEQSGDAQRREEAQRRWPADEGLGEFEMLLKDAEYGLGQIAELVLGLKDFSRVDRSLTELFSLNDGLDTALKICQSQLKGRVDVQREYGELPLVPCAPSQINQVFLNLISNAGQAIEGEGLITLRTRTEDDEAVVEVQDSGCGMDADTLAHIFEPFFTTKPVGKGTGLGLSIVFRIVEDHRGRIEVDSQPGQGTTFRLRLPLKARAATSTPASEAPGEIVLKEAFA
jgi:two-component system NtrC family sensor kinase